MYAGVAMLGCVTGVFLTLQELTHISYAEFQIKLPTPSGGAAHSDVLPKRMEGKINHRVSCSGEA